MICERCLSHSAGRRPEATRVILESHQRGDRGRPRQARSGGIKSQRNGRVERRAGRPGQQGRLPNPKQLLRQGKSRVRSLRQFHSESRIGGLVETRFHARATYRHTRDLKRQVDLFVYSAGDSARAFELHVSTKSESVCGRKGQIISDWHDEDQTLKAEGFLLDSMNIPDHDFDLKK